ncbi:MAG: ATP-binding cassette domain-containing protein [Firmicutes bacterium]|nr:ATP-binding cassette domain-containing protein [Bacillota bacterium]
MEDLLKVKNLKVTYKEKIEAIKGISFNVKKGETLGIIGESGSGKTSIANAILGLLSDDTLVRGEIMYDGVDLNKVEEKEMNKYRWNKVSMVFQNRLEVLNPVLKIKEQIIEAIYEKNKLDKEKLNKKVVSLLEMVGMDKIWLERYPHELSGGMRQKVLIAMALACEPEILIVDEPTSSLDASSKKEIISLLKELKEKNNLSLIVISHDINLIKTLTFNMIVLYSGYVLEEGITKEIIKEPKHTYTRGLINSSPIINPYKDLWGIKKEIDSDYDEGCPFYSRCNQSLDICLKKVPKLKDISLERRVACNRGGIVTLLKGKDITKTYKINKNNLYANSNCNIKVKSGEVVSLIGKSGSGKSTLGKILSGFLNKDSGEVLFMEERIKNFNAIRKLNGIQIVLQDPFSSMNEDFTIEDVIKEPLDILNIYTKDYRKKVIKNVLQDVELSKDEVFLNKRLRELSGGQRQRISLARSLVMKPKILIADEICSMLDPSTKANLLRLLKGLQNKNGFSMLYITHDLSVARKISDRVYVMKNGEIVENNNSFEIFNDPSKETTKELIDTGLKMIY